MAAREGHLGRREERAEVRKCGSNQNSLSSVQELEKKDDYRGPQRKLRGPEKSTVCPKGNGKGRQETGEKGKMSCPH